MSEEERYKVSLTIDEVRELKVLLDYEDDEFFDDIKCKLYKILQEA